VSSSPNEKCAPYRRFPSIERNRAINLDPANQALNLAAEAAVTSNEESSRADGKIMERSGSKVLLVLGMHRSGTSSIAGAMVRLGGAAPLNLLPPQDDNPRGFWESSVLVALNDQILTAAGSHWEDWRQFDPGRIDAAAAFALKDQAKSALAGEFGDASLAVIKDPRMCRLMPFWSSVFREANLSVRPVLQLRSPLEVALSLNRRDGIPLGLGCLIWLRHVLDAEAGTRGTRRAVVDWNDFLGAPRRTLERVGKQLDVIWPRWSDGALAEIDEFVSADMRRQRASDSDLQVHPAVNHLVREAYAVVGELVENPASEKVGRTLADIRQRFDGAAAIFGHAMFELEEGSRRAQSTAVALRNEYTAQLTAAREEFARQISGAATQVADMRGEFARDLAEASRELADARSEFARELAESSRQLGDARCEFERQLAEARSECRHLVDEANRKVARAEEIIAYLDRRYEPRSASIPKPRFLDYLRPRQKERKELTAIRNSAFFDAEFYLNSNPDVRASGMDAAVHYLVYGGREGRNPGPFFSTREYLVKFPDVAASGLNALAHYEIYGRCEMRRTPLSTP
jgi:hypothetical protein